MGFEVDWRGPQPRAGPFGTGAATSSWRVFQRLQAGHWPSHFGLDWPHSAQAKTVFWRGAGRDIGGGV